MQPRERVVEAFGVSRRNRRLRHQLGRHVFGQEPVARRDGASPVDAIRLVRQVNRDALRLLLLPAERALRARDVDAHFVLEADADLRRADERSAAVRQLAVHREVIVEQAARHEGLHLRGDVRDVDACHVAELHQRVRADVAAASRSAGPLGIDAPGRLLLPRGFKFGRQPALVVRAVHPPHVAEEPALHDETGEAGGPVAEIRMGHRERDAELPRRLHEGAGLFQCQAQRLLAEHRDAGLHGLHRRVVVHVIRRDNQDVVQPLVGRQRPIRRDHLVVRAVAPDGIRPGGRFLEGDRRLRVERAGNNAARAVEVNGLLVRVHDERALAAANQPDIEWSRHTPCLRSKEEQPRSRRLAPRAAADRTGPTCPAQAYINLGRREHPGSGRIGQFKEAGYDDGVEQAAVPESGGRKRRGVRHVFSA